MKLIATCLLISFITCTLSAQEETKGIPPTIYWQNPSFEGEPQDATVPVNWLPCAPMTTPDILPGVWGVYQEASDGETFVGLITRANGTFESITQRLSTPINKGDCYAFTIDLARGTTYSGYNKPLKLRVWASDDRCDKSQLIYESDFIENADWDTHVIKFSAEQPTQFIIFEAFYQQGKFSYTGNILLDNLTPLRGCPRA